MHPYLDVLPFRRGMHAVCMRSSGDEMNNSNNGTKARRKQLRKSSAYYQRPVYTGDCQKKTLYCDMPNDHIHLSALTSSSLACCIFGRWKSARTEQK